MSRRCPTCETSYPDEVFFCGQDGTVTVQEQTDPGDFDRRLGTTLSGYVIVARVADGAMGRVYEGRHPETRERVAIKVLHADVAVDNVAVERFKREFETAQDLAHPHIVKVLDFGDTADGSWFMTMEYLEGEELGELLRRDGTVPLARIGRILSQSALALEHAHSFGVIHRDLKPDNVFLCSSKDGDIVRLLDFGSVKLQVEMGPKLTAFGTTLGSPYYMSPEQAMGKFDVDSRTDVFALTAILFEMLTGKIAFEGRNVADILMKIVNGKTPVPTAVNPAIPSEFDVVVDRGLRKKKEERFDTVTQLAQAGCRALGLAGQISDIAATPQIQLAQEIGSASGGLAAVAPEPEPEPDEPPAFSAPRRAPSWPVDAPTADELPTTHITSPMALAVGLGIIGILLLTLILVLVM